MSEWGIRSESVEAAVESRRRAAQVFEPDVEVLPQYPPRLLRAISAVDDALYAMGAPHLPVCGAALTVMLLIVMVIAVR